MNNKDSQQEKLNDLVQQKARSFSYPPTPDIATQVRMRLTKPIQRKAPRLSWAIAILVLAAGMLLVVPQVRATLFDMIRAGAVTLILSEDQPAVSELSPLEERVFTAANILSPSDAQAQTAFELLVPAGLGTPDAIYLEQFKVLENPVAIMIWRDQEQSDGVQAIFYQINEPFFGIKLASASSVQSTRLNGSEAFWIEDQHTFSIADENEAYLVTRNVLVWSQGDITFRFETDLSFAEAVELAGSLDTLK